jgi:hypothetical protein
VIEQNLLDQPIIDRRQHRGGRCSGRRVVGRYGSGPVQDVVARRREHVDCLPGADPDHRMAPGHAVNDVRHRPGREVIHLDVPGPVRVIMRDASVHLTELREQGTHHDDL